MEKDLGWAIIKDYKLYSDYENDYSAEGKESESDIDKAITK